MSSLRGIEEMREYLKVRGFYTLFLLWSLNFPSCRTPRLSPRRRRCVQSNLVGTVTRRSDRGRLVDNVRLITRTEMVNGRDRRRHCSLSPPPTTIPGTPLARCLPLSSTNTVTAAAARTATTTIQHGQCSGRICCQKTEVGFACFFWILNRSLSS
jgi:hypothetical protein